MKIKNRALWENVIESNKTFYGMGILSYAESWADMMEKEISNGKKLEDIAEKTSYDADTSGITGFMYGCAVSILAECWEHGEELRVWHNKKYGVEDAKGTVNPAVLTIKTKD